MPRSMPYAKTRRKDDGCHPHLRSRVLLLESRFQYAHRCSVLGRARLFASHIELTHWDVHGWHRRHIPLTHVAEVNYHALADNANLSVTLDTTEQVHLNIEEAHRWREVFEHWLEYAVLPSAKLTRSLDEVAALAG